MTQGPLWAPDPRWLVYLIDEEDEQMTPFEVGGQRELTRLIIHRKTMEEALAYGAEQLGVDQRRLAAVAL